VAFLLATLLYPPLVLLLLCTFLGVGLVDYRVRKPIMTLPAFYFYYAMEQLSYGTGVFWGCFEMKSFASYRFELLVD